MFSSRRKPVFSTPGAYVSSSSEDLYRPASRPSSPVPLRQLIAGDLDRGNVTGYNPSPYRQREPFRIPRPTITVPPAAVLVPNNRPSGHPTLGSRMNESFLGNSVPRESAIRLRGCSTSDHLGQPRFQFSIKSSRLPYDDRRLSTPFDDRNTNDTSRNERQAYAQRCAPVVSLRSPFSPIWR